MKQKRGKPSEQWLVEQYKQQYAKAIDEGGNFYQGKTLSSGSGGHTAERTARDYENQLRQFYGYSDSDIKLLVVLVWYRKGISY